MKTGNKNQAVMLAIVAVGALVFLGKQLMPAKLIKLGVLNTPMSQPVAQVGDTNHLPLTLVGNPFSHPKLAVVPVTNSPIQGPPNEIDKNGPLDPSGGSVDPLPGTGKNTGAPGSTPEGNAGDDRRKDQAPPEIHLTAVMAVREPIAVLEVNGEGATEFSVGDVVAKDTKLIKIEDRGVTVKFMGALHFIAMGGTYGKQETKQ